MICSCSFMRNYMLELFIDVVPFMWNYSFKIN